MADINIEKKRRSPLPLILGVLALALLAFLLMTTCADDEPEPVEGTVVDTTTAVTPAPTSAAPVTTTP
jgi:hypothetical protein